MRGGYARFLSERPCRSLPSAPLFPSIQVCEAPFTVSCQSHASLQQPSTPCEQRLIVSPEIIPAPIATPGYNVDYGFGDHAGTRRVLDQLSAGAASAERAEGRLRQTLYDVQRLLDPDALIEFQFKKPNIPSSKKQSGSQVKYQPPKLSSFAKMALDESEIQFRYLTPESDVPSRKATVTGHNLTDQKESATPTTHPVVHVPQSNGFHPSDSSEFAPSSQPLQAVIPSVLTPGQRAEYKYVDDRNLHHDKRQGMATPGRAISVDQRQKGDTAVQQLQSLVGEIFDAEDQMPTDPADAPVTGAMQAFSFLHTGDGPVTVLQPAMQERLDSAVQSVTKHGRLEGIPVEDLLRVSKISERAVSGMTSTNLEIGDDWSQDDAQEWSEKLGMADCALVASRTLLRIMTAGRQEKELQSEDYVRSILDLMKNVIDSGLVPVAEERSFVGEKIRGGDKPQTNPKFVLATQYRDALRVLLQSLTKSLRLLAGLLSRVDVDESAISSVVFMCKSLIFSENATNEKDSVLGIQLFEGTRKHAMDVIARILTRYPTQRQFVIDEILVSLEKLPATKQSARQYRVPDAKPIQLVSALLMRLVQTSATRNSTAMHLRSKTENEDEGSDADSEDEDEDAEAETDDEGIKVSPTKRGSAPKDLGSLVKPLHDAATTDASYIIRILIQRALMVSKSSDEPFRKLLDLFTEDFMNVLGSSDWPAAELLLRLMLLQMMNIVREPSTPVGPKNLALELMGTLASGILQLQKDARNAANNVNANESPMAGSLVSLFEQIDTGDVDSSAFNDFNGPYRIVLEYLHARDTGGDAQLQTARGFHLVQWAQQVAGGRASSVDSDGSTALGSRKDLESKLRNMIIDPQWLEEHYEAWNVSTQVGRLSASLIVLNSTFCRAFSNIFRVLVAATTDEHPTVKSRALRSVATVLEKDPSVLDRNRSILRDIIRTTEDNSALVRDAAVGIVAKCLSMRPELDTAVLEDVIRRTRDAAPGVRKKATKLLKDIYLRNESTNVRSSIANAIIARIGDAEESVSELARATIEEIWFAPFHGLSLQGENAVQAKLQYRSQAALLIQTVALGESVIPVLQSLAREILTKSKTAPANIRVCEILVGVLFDGIIDPADIPGSPSQDIILETLTVFAKAYPTLVDSSQIERLEPYTKNLTSNDDLAVYRSVLAILRHTMPHIPSLQQGFLQNIQNSLLTSMSKLPKTEIGEVAACLWTIDGELKNTFRLVNLIASALTNIRAMKGEDFSADPKKVNRITKLMAIVGQFGKACDFEAQISDFRDKLAQPKAKTVAGLMIEILCTFTSPKQPLNIREASLEAVCAICQRWPKQFLRSDVTNTVDRLLKDRTPTLEHIFIDGLEGFFATLNVPADGQDGADGAAPETGRERLAKTYIATDQDGASSELAQRFLQDILRLATSSFDDLALTATKLIASILQQGLPHPKECGPSLVALETSPNPEIAHIAFAEHRTMHQKHETTIEKEYVRAVQKSFEYQERVAGSPVGFTGPPPVSKLRYFFEVLKSGKGKVRHKFLNNISQRLEFDPAELDVRAATPSHLAFVRYCCENVAFFEYGDTVDLLNLIPALEKVFSGVGTALAQVIESDILKLHVDEAPGAPPVANGIVDPAQPTTTSSKIDPARLRSLAVSARILLIIWATRSFLANVYNLRNVKRRGKAPKEGSGKPPARVTNAPTLIDAYIKRIAHIMACPPTPEAQHRICNEFVEVISVDNEAKVPSEEEEDAELDGGGSGAESASRKSPSATPGKGRKRKSVGSGQGGAPRKRERLSGSGKGKSSSAKAMDEDEDSAWD